MNTPTEITAVPLLPPRPVSGHKGLFGRVLIVGGSDHMLGAPVLAGTAALRMGSGLVQIAVPKSMLAAALSVTPELIGLALGSADTELMAAAKLAGALVIGPGLGQSPAARRRVLKLTKLKLPMVIDADALNILAGAKKWPAEAILTPHPGEMKRLIKKPVPTDDAGRIALATAYARSWNVTLVLKGDRTVVTDGTRYYLNHTGDSSLSKAGSGDILSGMLGCLLCQKMAPFDAACLAVHLHGLAGQTAGQKLGRRSVLSRDVIDSLPKVLKLATSN